MNVIRLTNLLTRLLTPLVCHTGRMIIQKFRWSKVYESSEEELIELLDAMGIYAERRAFDEFETAKITSPAQENRLWCAEGSMIVKHGSKNISIQPGDGLVIPANTDYELEAGIAGCAIYLQA